MRQRRPKNLEEKIALHDQFLISDPESLKGRWRSVFYMDDAASAIGTDAADAIGTDATGRKLYLEIGCGKGQFINELAKSNKRDLFIGFEGQDTVILRALEKVKQNELLNLKMSQYYINDFDSIFGSNELDGIYLNFSDPWPKGRHEKRRLTSPRYLDGYFRALKPGGFIKMKTDNENLFSYSADQFESHCGFDILEISEDLHSSAFNEGNIMTEYEKKFIKYEKKINYIKVIRK